MKNIITLAALVCSCCFALSSCNNNSQNFSDLKNNAPSPSQSNTSQPSQPYRDEDMIVPEIQDGDNVFVMQIEDTPISYNLFRYYFMTYKAEMDGGDELFWKDNDKAKQELSLTIVDSVKMHLALQQIADNENIALTEQEISTIDEACDKFKEGFDSQQEFESFLSEKYLTEQLFREQEKIYVLADKVKTYYCEQIQQPLTDDQYFEMLFEVMNPMKVIFYNEENSQEYFESADPEEADDIVENILPDEYDHD